MVDDDGLEYAVPHYRDPKKTARIVAARRCGERVKDIAAREGVSPQRVSYICRDAGLTARRSTTPPPKPCAECGKLLRDRSAVYCSRKCAQAALSPDPVGKRLYELRRDGAATWTEIADSLGWRPDLPRPARRVRAAAGARRYAEAHGLPWPLPDRARSEHLASRAEKRAAAAQEIEEAESRIRALLDELPKDRTITEPEAERFLVALYGTGRGFTWIAARTNCSASYVEKVVRRRAPELIRPREHRGRRAPPAAPLLDLREVRKNWRAEGYRRRRVAQDARMLAAYLAGESLRDIARREGLGRDAVMKRISGATPKPP